MHSKCIQHNAFSVIMLSVVMLSVVMLNVVMLSVVMLSVVMLSVVVLIGTTRLNKVEYWAHRGQHEKGKQRHMWPVL
jgi:hypothetical protein